MRFAFFQNAILQNVFHQITLVLVSFDQLLLEGTGLVAAGQLFAALVLPLVDRIIPLASPQDKYLYVDKVAIGEGQIGKISANNQDASSQEKAASFWTNSPEINLIDLSLCKADAFSKTLASHYFKAVLKQRNFMLLFDVNNTKLILELISGFLQRENSETEARFAAQKIYSNLACIKIPNYSQKSLIGNTPIFGAILTEKSEFLIFWNDERAWTTMSDGNSLELIFEQITRIRVFRDIESSPPENLRTLEILSSSNNNHETDQVILEIGLTETDVAEIKRLITCRKLKF